MFIVDQRINETQKLLRQSPLSQLTDSAVEPGRIGRTVQLSVINLEHLTDCAMMSIANTDRTTAVIDALSNRLNGCKRRSRCQCLMTSFTAEFNTYQLTHLGLLSTPSCAAASTKPQTHRYTRWQEFISSLAYNTATRCDMSDCVHYATFTSTVLL